MGNTHNDNARWINEQRALAASYFPAWDCSADGDCDDGNPATEDTCNTMDRACVFRPIPTSAPSRSPVSSAPTHDLSSYSSLGFLETFAIVDVGEFWQTISLSASFTSPVPVCTVQYDSGSSLTPAVVRMLILSSNSFAIRLQEASANPSSGSVGFRNVKCIVVEEGSWKLPDGNQIEAHQVGSIVTDGSTSWIGSQQQLDGTYSQPVVIGQVTSANDPRWSVFWSRGADLVDCADQDNFWVGLHVGEDPETTRNPESIGYIIMENGIHRFVSTCIAYFGVFV